MRKKLILFTAMFMLIQLCACQPAPNSDVVISKNDGSFEETINSEPSSFIAPGSYSNSFKSIDGSVAFEINADVVSPATIEFPIVKIRPHSITAEEAKAISIVLFGDSMLFERENGRALTRDEIEEKLILWNQLKSENNLREIFGEDPSRWEIEQETLDRFVSKYSSPAVINSAPTKHEQTPCQWFFYPWEHYWGETAGTPTEYSGNKAIEATTTINGIPYCFTVNNRDKNDYQIHGIHVFIGSDLPDPDFIEKKRVLSRLYSGTKPSDQQLIEVKNTAETMIANMGMGDWYIDSCEYESIVFSNAKTMYGVIVHAVPTYGKIPVTYQPQLTNLKSENTYSSNYYYSEMSFEFSPEGTLIDFHMESPVDIIEISNPGVNVLEFATLMELGETNLKLWDVNSVSPYAVLSKEAAKYSGQIYIDEIRIGLSRVKIKDNNTDYYIVPSITLYARISVFDEKGNLYYDSYEDTGDNHIGILTINAIDGSLINTFTNS